MPVATKEKTRWNVPEAKQYGKKFTCPKCQKKCLGLGPYKSHYLRAHSEEFKKHLKTTRAAQSTSTKQRRNDETSHQQPTQVSDLLGIAKAVLQAHGGTIKRRELIAGIRAAGYSRGDNNALGSALRHIIKSDPDCGISRPRRGIYVLGKVRKKYTRRTSSREVAKPTVESMFTPEVELAILRQKAAKTQILVMGMCELFLRQMDDDTPGAEV